MWAPRVLTRSLRLLAAVALALAATLAASVPAQAAATATITRSGATLVINASAAPATVYLGWSTQYGDPTVTLRLPGEGFASWPSDCGVFYPAGLPDQYVHCWADSVDDLDVTFGPGNDTLYMDGACYGVITVRLGEGANTMQGDTDCPQTVINSTSGSGDDVIQMAAAGGTVAMGAGNDQFRGGNGNETVSGGPGNDSLGGAGGNDVLNGDDGNDAIAGGYGNDVENGGNGDDFIGENDDDQGADDLVGGPGVDTIWFRDHTGGGMSLTMDDVANDGIPGEGDNLHSDFEIVLGSLGADTIVGTAGPDNLDGFAGNDIVRGGPGNDRLEGNTENDQLFGEAGNDEMYGGSANDTLDGGPGSDQLFGDYTSCCLSNGSDTIDAVDGEVDQVSCGGGPDVVRADAGDVVSQDAFMGCESITRATPPPGGGSGGGGGGGGAGSGAAALVVNASLSGKASRRDGVKIATRCSARCAVAAGVAISKKLAKRYGLKKVLIGTGRGASASGGSFRVKVRISAQARRKLSRAGTIKALVVLVVADAAGTEQTKAFKIKLRP